MGKLDWYRRYPDKWFGGTRKLSFEERGAYADIIELIMLNDGSVEDDDVTLAAMLVCQPRVWKRIKEQLVAHGKLVIEDGFIRNRKCSEVLQEHRSFVERCQEGGRKSAEQRAEKLRNSDITRRDSNIARRDSEKTVPLEPKSMACVEPPSNHYTTVQEVSKKERTFLTEGKKESCASPLAQPTERPAPRGSRLPEGWQLSDADREYAQQRGLSLEATSAMALDFEQYWRAKAGKDAVKCDWRATWQRWVRNSENYNHGSSGTGRNVRSQIIEFGKELDRKIQGIDGEMADPSNGDFANPLQRGPAILESQGFFLHGGSRRLL